MDNSVYNLIYVDLKHFTMWILFLHFFHFLLQIIYTLKAFSMFLCNLHKFSYVNAFLQNFYYSSILIFDALLFLFSKYYKYLNNNLIVHDSIHLHRNLFYLQEKEPNQRILHHTHIHVLYFERLLQF